MPITTLTPDAMKASKAAALLASQVHKDLIATSTFTQAEAVVITGHIVAALLDTGSENSSMLGILPSRIGR